MRFPLPPKMQDATLSTFLVRLIGAITKANDENLKKDIPQASALLVSPNGTVYTVTVTDAGVLTTTKVHG